MAFLNSLLAKFPLFVLSLGAFAHFLAGGFAHHTVVVVQNSPVVQNAATTTKSSAIATPAKKIIPSKAAALPTQKAPPASAVVQTPPPTTSTSQTSAVPATLDTPQVSADAAAVEDLNAKARASLVNILCTTAAGGSFAPISGSGVIIDSRGIILTNAHVAQYLLLKDYPYANNISCVVRMGSPAKPMYTTDVIYLPKEWVDANASELTADKPMGTGENDFAFLRITGPVSSSIQMPSSFPALPITTDAPLAGAPVLLAAYPAGLLDGQTIQENLYTSSAVSAVENVYTFNDAQNVDLISLEGSVVSQTGSSGGALLGLGSKELIGLISTESQGTTTSDRILNAISTGYINRALQSQGQGGIAGFLSADPTQKEADYEASIKQAEMSELEAVLRKASGN